MSAWSNYEKRYEVISINIAELQDMAHILRRDVLKMTTAAGSGHPSSCLSCAELLSAVVFRAMRFDTSNPHHPDNDSLVMSKGHAAPLLYAAFHRAGCTSQDPMTLRKFSSPYEGHPLPSRFAWAPVATGSLGQGLSNGVGIALAGRLAKREYRTYVIMGDSELAEGSVWEGAELAGHYCVNSLCALIDVNRLGQTGPTMHEHDLRGYAKRFKALGWNAIRVDGHNMKAIILALRRAQRSYRPSVIIAKTYKGHGVGFMDNRPGWHGRALTPQQLTVALEGLPEPPLPEVVIRVPIEKQDLLHTRSRNVGAHYAKGQQIATRQAYGHALEQLSHQDDKLIVLDAEVGNSTFSDLVNKRHPHQFIQTYIAEQNMISVAAGLASRGMHVHVATFAAFLTRAHDQLRMASLSTLSLVVCGSHAGVSIGEDGASQMGLEDLSMMRSLPTSTVFYPADAIATEHLTTLASALEGITYIRTSRPAVPVIYTPNTPFVVGGSHILVDHPKPTVVIVTAGVTVYEALAACELVGSSRIKCVVVDCYSIKPIDQQRLVSLAKRCKRFVVVEDHYAQGGLGEAVGLALSGCQTHIKHLCIRYIPHSGKGKELLAAHGIDAAGIAQAVKEISTLK